MAPVVAVVYQCSISNAMGILKHFCIAWFMLFWIIRKTPAASSNLSNYYLTLVCVLSRAWFDGVVHHKKDKAGLTQFEVYIH